MLCLPLTHPGLLPGPWNSGLRTCLGGQAANLPHILPPIEVRLQVSREDMWRPPWGNRSRAEPAHREPRAACEPAGSSAGARLLWESVTAPFGATHMPRASVAWVWDGCLSGREEAHTWESRDQEEQGLASGHAPNASFWQRCPELCPHFSPSHRPLPQTPRAHPVELLSWLRCSLFTAVPSASASSEGCN